MALRSKAPDLRTTPVKKLGLGSNSTPDKNVLDEFLLSATSYRFEKIQIYKRSGNKHSVDGVMATIVSFQAIDPGSTPGQRRRITFLYSRLH